MTTKKPAIRQGLAPKSTDARSALIPTAPEADTKPAPGKKKAPANAGAAVKPAARPAKTVERRITVQLNSRVELDVAELVESSRV